MFSLFSLIRKLVFNDAEHDRPVTVHRRDEDRVGLQNLAIKKEHSLQVTKKKQEVPGLVDLVFSWSISDIMNKDLYKDKVKRIPVEFSFVDQYFQSFINPLVEETHADLFSKMTTLFHEPACEVVNVICDAQAEGSVYIALGPGEYEPEIGDLIAFTEVKPRCIDDLDRPRRTYLIGYVDGMDEDGILPHVVCSKPLMFEKKEDVTGRARQKLFAVHLTNLTTNIRIWKGLHPDLEGGNLKLINTVLISNPSVEENCTLCISDKDESINLTISREAINPLGLDNSQKAAVLNTIGNMECHHKNKVKLIWGPPGTGKTKTIATLLFALIKINCRTLTCAPTNVAVLGVTKRLMSLLQGTLMYDMYGLGNIVLLGNGERMKIDDNEGLSNVHLDRRVYILARCFAPLTGWKGSLESTISLLEDPENQYGLYLRRVKDENEKNPNMCNDDELSMEEKSQGLGETERKHWNQKIIHDKKESKKRKSWARIGSRKDKRKDEKSESHEIVIPWTFEEYVLRTYRKLVNDLMLYIIGMCTHMPTSYLPVEVLKKMIEVHETLGKLRSLLNNFKSPEGLRQALQGNMSTSASKQLTMLCQIRLQCLAELKHLRSTFSVPYFLEHHLIRSFCLKNAVLIFCTASSSSKLQTEGMTPIDLVIIDEAAHLKECESSIPLQLFGLRRAILVGDEKQLPAMVQSKICDKAGFGRSLFERLVILKQSKQLLNVQYRMHPSISFFPNKEFYGEKIKNGQNVMGRGYERRFLKGIMFGSYSFIDINCGKEDFGDGHSLKNMVEVSVVAEIVSKLCDEHTRSKQKVSIGCISPYKAQVRAIQERLGNTYSADVNAMFSVNVRSVDGFQGGEEDVIIISTVRSNGNGSIGFLSNFQRTNVALTRARYCLWILGNGATLLNSGTVWKRLVMDAKRRQKFFNAYEDKGLALAISNALVDLNQLDSLFCTDSILFRTSKWKVMFSAQFQESMPRLQQLGVHKDVSALLVKLLDGWRDQMDDKRLGKMECASSQLLEIYDVKEPLKLIWTIHILTEKEKHTQVIKVWDVLPGSDVPKLAKTLDVLLGNNSVDYVNRCMCKRVEGNMTLPVTWPVDTNAASSTEDTSRDLAGKLGGLTMNAAGSSGRSWRSKRQTK